mmetsp:Transcript_11921/g.17090  ORF Transcript_11921/g.17090 Transcript_11921/m.17090 type:complete len:262 (-) Transcript_11921:165-950(-)
MSLPSWLQEHCARLESNDPELLNLNLNIRRLNFESMRHFSQALQSNNVLQILNLTSSLVTPSDIRPLAAILVDQKSLQVIHLSYNQLKDIPHFEPVLRSNQSIRHLYFNFNRLTNQSAIALAEGLTQNTSLEVLDLSWNKIGDPGAVALAAMLHHNTTLKYLGLSRNLFELEGAKAIYQALHVNTDITRLDFSDNSAQIPVQYVLEVERLCLANKYGRKLMSCQDLPSSIWPRVLARKKEQRQADMIYYFLTSQPELCKSS